MVKERRLKNRRYINGFDGLRTIGVLGVILYHLMPYKFTGGFLGVPIFMVVSGYLITDLLNQEWQQNQKINLLGFYKRRIKRLLPGLLSMLLITSAYITLFSRTLLYQLKSIVITNILGVYNWWQIANGQSYFERFANNESPFTHLWTLSIEAQFYLIWPFIFVFLVLFVKNQQKSATSLLVISLASAILMALLFQPGQDPSRVYYGTDTRVFSITLGAALAFIWPSNQAEIILEKSKRRLLNLLGLITLGLIIYLLITIQAQSAFVYYGGFLIFSFLVAFLVAIIVHPAAAMNRLLSNPLFDWIGKRSYGIYLYQFPVMIFFENQVTNIAQHTVLYPIIEVAIILVITELSYRLIEKPLAKMQMQVLISEIRSLIKHPRVSIKLIFNAILLLVMMIGLVGVFQSSSVTASKNPDQAKLSKKITANQKATQKRNQEIIAKSKKTDKQKTKDKPAVSRKSETVTESELASGVTEKERATAQEMPVTAIGDSVLSDASVDLQKVFPLMLVDAKVGRQAYDSAPIIQSYANKGLLSTNVLLSLGTNGAFSDKQLDEIMAIIGDKRHVFWLNTFVPTRSWQNQVNKTLDNAKKRYPNLTVIDWYDVAKKHGDWFYADQVHPNLEGNQQYVNLITKTLVK